MTVNGSLRNTKTNCRKAFRPLTTQQVASRLHTSAITGREWMQISKMASAHGQLIQVLQKTTQTIETSKTTQQRGFS
jgi:hypothetical protein